MHAGVHVPASGVTEGQSPIPAFIIEGSELQSVDAVHSPVTTHAPVLHVATGVPKNPKEQVAVQLVPLGVVDPEGGQFPKLAPTGRLGDPKQLFGVGEVVQDPEISHVPCKHVAVGVPTNPVLHERLHVVPFTELATQVPLAASGITGGETHEVLLQIPEVIQVPLSHVATKIPEYPALQTG